MYRRFVVTLALMALVAALTSEIRAESFDLEVPRDTAWGVFELGYVEPRGGATSYTIGDTVVTVSVLAHVENSFSDHPFVGITVHMTHVVDGTINHFVIAYDRIGRLDFKKPTHKLEFGIVTFKGEGDIAGDFRGAIASLLDSIGSREYENIPRYMKADLYASEYRDQRLQAVAPEGFAKAVRACADGFLYNVLGTPRSVQTAKESHGRLWLTIYFDENEDIQRQKPGTHAYQVGLDNGELYVLKMKNESGYPSAYGVVTTPEDVEQALGFVRDFLTHGFSNQKTGSFGTDAAGPNNGS